MVAAAVVVLFFAEVALLVMQYIVYKGMKEVKITSETSTDGTGYQIASRGYFVMDSIFFASNNLTNFTNAESLRITKIKMVVLKDEAFMELALTLHFLYIYANNEVQFEHGAFSGLNELRFLSLDNNAIKELPSELFGNLPNLNRLSIRRNKLTVLNGDDFRQLNKLTYMDLSFNQIETVTGGMNGPKIDLLVFGNKLSTLKPADLDGFRLRRLNVGNNSIPETVITELKERIRFVYDFNVYSP